MRIDPAVLTASGTSSALLRKPIVKLKVQEKSNLASQSRSSKRGWKSEKVKERGSL